MANDLLKKLEEKINEAIETIELSRMEVSDLKEQNDELENRYSDWETRLSTLIEKFEQLEDSENGDVEEVSAAMQSTEGETEEEVEAAEILDSEEVEAAEILDSEEVEAAEILDSEEEEEQDSDEEEEELGSTFNTSADSFTESTESAQHYA